MANYFTTSQAAQTVAYTLTLSVMNAREVLELRKFESGIRINITMSHRLYTMYSLLAKQ
jgi:hypothetical protein